MESNMKHKQHKGSTKRKVKWNTNNTKITPNERHYWNTKITSKHYEIQTTQRQPRCNPDPESPKRPDRQIYQKNKKFHGRRWQQTVSIIKRQCQRSDITNQSPLNATSSFHMGNLWMFKYSANGFIAAENCFTVFFCLACNTAVPTAEEGCVLCTQIQ